jgi:hypothetical protein
MKQVFASTAIAFVLLANGRAAAAQTQPGVGALGWLVGGTWTAMGAGLPENLDRIEVRYRWSFTKNFIQFETKFVGTSGATTAAYAGNIFFDPAGHRLAIWYMDLDNVVTQGPVSVEPGRTVFSFSGPGQAAGQTQTVDYRVELTQTTPDTYHWALFAYTDRAWRPLYALNYVHSE